MNEVIVTEGGFCEAYLFLPALYLIDLKIDVSFSLTKEGLDCTLLEVIEKYVQIFYILFLFIQLQTLTHLCIVIIHYILLKLWQNWWFLKGDKDISLIPCVMFCYVFSNLILLCRYKIKHNHHLTWILCCFENMPNFLHNEMNLLHSTHD